MFDKIFSSDGGCPVPMPSTTFACVTLNLNDTLRLINFSEAELKAVQLAAITHWSGVRYVRDYGGSKEIELKGSPWAHDSNGDDDARRLLMGIFENLFELGWVLYASVAITAKADNKDSLVFRKQVPPPPPYDWIAVSFDHYNKLKIVGKIPKELVSDLLTTFSGQMKRQEIDDKRVKLIFNDSHWYPHGKATVDTRLLLLTLIETLERSGFTVYASIDQTTDVQSTHTTTDSDPDVMICHRRRDWVPGMPVWHR